MALPGFTAESSIGPLAQAYRVQHHPGIAPGGMLVPQQFEGLDFGEMVEDDLQDDIDLEVEDSGLDSGLDAEAML